jgi:thioredoxin 2
MSQTFAQCSKCFALNKIDTDKALKQKPVCGKCASEVSIHGLVASVNTNNFRKIISMSKGKVIIDFWASWCGPCKMYGPEFEKASIQNPQTVFLKINTEEEQQLAGELGIRGIPCTIIFQDGTEIKRQSGAMSAEQVKALL